jgi:TRAP transporter 4TM/12TM fusion protein
VTDQPSASGAPQHISAASEERFIATTEELAKETSRATVVAAMTLQTLLVACVVLWVLDVPRLVFNVSFYTEQLLAVTLGLTLALAFTTETSRKHTPFDLAGAIASAVIVVYLIYSYRRDGEIVWPAVAGLAAALGWTFTADRIAVARWLDWVCMAASLALCAYITVRYEALTYELAMLPLEGVVGSAILTFLVLEASRRISGWGFVGIILAIAVYVYISPFLAGDFQTRWVSPERMVAYVGIPFTILGQVLARTGGADFFADLAMSAMWRFRGGAAKVAVVGSALFGMISGSAVSNVLAVGVVTIPAMKKSGFSAYRAAAIESVGSTGGQLMPPVMGASAFIMAEFLQVSYGTVCIAAAIPAILYYGCLFIHVDLEAAKNGIGGVELDDAPSLTSIIKSGWHFLVPIVFLVMALMYPNILLLTPEKAAVASTALLIVLALIFGYRGKQTSIKEITLAVIETGRVSLDIILIGAAAGIMVGIMSISGLAFSMTLQLLALSGDNVFLLLILIAVLAFVLGIGLPTVSVYILTATLLAPALVKLGVTPMAAHMFVMYNGLLSMITPPVAFAAYAAANIARTDGWTTGWVACLVGWSTFVLPFLFVLTPSLLMDGPGHLIVWNFVRILFGLFVGTAAIVGFALTPLSMPMRIVYGLLALPIVMPPEAVANGYAVNFIGIGLGIALLVIDHLRRKRAATTAAPA